MPRCHPCDLLKTPVEGTQGTRTRFLARADRFYAAEGEAHAKQKAYASSFGCGSVCTWQGCGHCFGMRGFCPSSVCRLPGKSPQVAPSPMPAWPGRLSFALSPSASCTSGHGEGAEECAEIPPSPNRNVCCCSLVLSDKTKHKQ